MPVPKNLNKKQAVAYRLWLQRGVGPYRAAAYAKKAGYVPGG